MTEKTISINNQNPKNWIPDQEGQRFKEFLYEIKKENPSLNESKISEQSAQIISQCMNPFFKTEKHSSVGLVLGQVQSGKTLSMTAVTAMAQDNGYGIVIVMSGSVSPLSNQTARTFVSPDDASLRKWSGGIDLMRAFQL